MTNADKLRKDFDLILFVDEDDTEAVYKYVAKISINSDPLGGYVIGQYSSRAIARELGEVRMTKLLNNPPKELKRFLGSKLTLF